MCSTRVTAARQQTVLATASESRDEIAVDCYQLELIAIDANLARYLGCGLEFR